MVQRGHALLSDDIVALVERADGFYAIPGYAMLGLWPEAMQALYGTANAAPAFSENIAKRRLLVGSRQFACQAVPLGAILMLEDRNAESSAPRVQRATAQQAMMSLVANTYANLLLDDEMRAREFAFLGRLVNAIPVHRLRAHAEISQIGALCELIENEVASTPLSSQVAAKPS